MRAIALAVCLGALGIECAIRGTDIPINAASSTLALAFIVCLFFGW